MNEDQIKIISSTLGTERILFDEQLKSHTYFHQETKSRMYFEALNSSDLELAVSTCIKNKIPFIVLGLGANTFLPENSEYFLIKNLSHNIILKGFRTLIIEKKSVPEVLIQVDSGASLTMLARYCIHEKIEGLGFLLNIPGSVGAGIRNNISLMPTVKNIIGNYLSLAEIIDAKTGEKKLVDNSYFEFDYDRSKLQQTNDIVIKAVFKLPKTSPNNPWSAGSNDVAINHSLTGPIFKNISHRDAVRLSTKHFTLSPSYLIRQIDIGGYKIGGVTISSEDPNTFILDNDFKTEDIARMMRYIKRNIKNKFKLTLESRIDIINKI